MQHLALIEVSLILLLFIFILIAMAAGVVFGWRLFSRLFLHNLLPMVVEGSEALKKHLIPPVSTVPAGTPAGGPVPPAAGAPAPANAPGPESLRDQLHHH